MSTKLSLVPHARRKACAVLVCVAVMATVLLSGCEKLGQKGDPPPAPESSAVAAAPPVAPLGDAELKVLEAALGHPSAAERAKAFVPALRNEAANAGAIAVSFDRTSVSVSGDQAMVKAGASPSGGSFIVHLSYAEGRWLIAAAKQEGSK